MSREMINSDIPWIGDIPKGWNRIFLKHYFHFEKGKNAAIYTQEYIGSNLGDFPVYSGQTENQGIMGRINTFDYDESECLFTTTVGAKVMTPKILQGKFSLSQNCLIMKKIKDASVHWFFYGLSALFDYEKSLIPSHMQPSLRIEDLKKYILYIPSITEQQKMASFLDRKCAEIDEMIALQEKIIGELKAYKQAVITEAVTKGLNPDVPMKDSGIEWIGEIPKHWETHPFKAFYKTTKGLNITKDNLVENGTPVISYGQIHSKHNTGTSISEELIRYVPTDYIENFPECLSKKYDIFFADTSEDREGAGNVAFIDVEEPIFAGYHTIIARPTEKVQSKYFAYLIKTDAWRCQLRCKVQGVKLFSISQKFINQTFIIIPSMEEQLQISEHLDKKCAEIDSLIKIKLSKIDSLKEYKKSIIYEYVTGKKEVI